MPSAFSNAPVVSSGPAQSISRAVSSRSSGSAKWANTFSPRKVWRGLRLPNPLRSLRLVGYETELVVHAEARHHVACNVGRLVQIVGRPGGCLIEDQHLGGPVAEKDGQSVFQVAARQQEAVLGRAVL